MSRPGPALGIYRFLSPLLMNILEGIAPLSAKLRRGLEGRHGLMPRLLAAGPGLEGCIWFHATSVGEYEQARPMIRLLREAGIGPIAVTHYSPSGLDYARENADGDFHDFLPLDRPSDMEALMRSWRPRALVFIKYDCWPNQVLAAHRFGVPIFLFSAALPAASGRLGVFARPVFRSLFNHFTRIGTGHAADQDRFVASLGVTIPTCVSGDTRAEQVIERFEASSEAPLPASLRSWGGLRLVLGSTWPEDEAIWWPALPGLLEAFPDLKLILVPHEPHLPRLQEIESRLATAGLKSIRLSDWDQDIADRDAYSCLLVDRIGVLAGLYHAGDLAYVGGSFTTGVHSTLEPAIAGLPILFGPRIGNAEEALLMVGKGAGQVVRDSADALQAASTLLDQPDRREAAGQRARDIVLAQRGAARRSVDLLLEDLGGIDQAS